MGIRVKCVLTEQATSIVVVARVVVVGIEWWIVPSPSSDVIVYVTVDGISNPSTITAVAALATEVPVIVGAVSVASVKSGA